MASSSSSSSPELTHVPALDSSFFKYASLDDALEELSTRFIMNLPDQELASVERLCFQVEQAHWYYDDFMREANSKLPNLNLKRFSQLFFDSCPLLRQWSSDHEGLFNTFMQYKTRVPVCGAIMLNDKWDKCLLVKGWKSSAGWGFPKGKINQREELHCCAIREVQEETGFNLEKYIKPGQYIEMTIREQSVTLFVVGGIPEDYPFQTRTRKEISKIEWFKLSNLPMWKRSNKHSSKFYLIAPFMPHLREFIKANGPKRRQEYRRIVVNAAANLSVRTSFDANSFENAESSTEGKAEGFVNLEREVHISSSSSADNGEPQTPSPQSAGSYSMSSKHHFTNGEDEQPLDPHFVRLMNGLSLSAQQQPLRANKDKSAKKALIFTSQLDKRKSTDPIIEDVCDKVIKYEESSHEADDPSETALPMQCSSDRATQSPISSADSTGSTATARPPTSEAYAFSNDRHLKYVALLESLANESAAPPRSLSSSCPIAHPGPPSSVPPFSARFNEQCDTRYTLPLDRLGYPTPYPGTGYPEFSSDNPFTVRPTTSHAFFPPSVMPQRRQGQALSMHQGSLLSILKGSNAIMHTASTQGSGDVSTSEPSATDNTIVPSNLPSNEARTVRPQFLGTIPISRSSFPLSLQAINEPSLPSGIPGFNASQSSSQASSKANLLSILNPISIARPLSALPTDTRRPNYISGGQSYPSLPQGNAHR